MEPNINKEEALAFIVERNVKVLFREFLRILESIGAENDIAIQRLKRALPENYAQSIELSNSMPIEKRGLFRKRVLDLGNDTIRTISEEIANMQFFKKDKDNE